MSAKLIVRQEAEADIAEAYRWYEARRPGLGQDFLDALETAFARIVKQPLRTAQVHRRRTFLRDDNVHVIAVLHQRRNPRLARSRSTRFAGG